jgi:hypothetical protein
MLSSKPWNPHHVREWNENEFLELLQPWFRVIDVLGQRPMAGWKAHLIDLAANRPWLKAATSNLRPSKREVKTLPMAAAHEQVIPRRISRWQVPLYTLCVAEAKTGSGLIGRFPLSATRSPEGLKSAM